jgi:hypothetical protein
LENDQSVARRDYAIVQDLEPGADAEALYFRLDHPLGRLHQRLLHLTNADRQGAWNAQAFLDHQLAEEVTFA